MASICVDAFTYPHANVEVRQTRKRIWLWVPRGWKRMRGPFKNRVIHWPPSEPDTVAVAGELLREAPGLISAIPWEMSLVADDRERDLYVFQRKPPKRTPFSALAARLAFGPSS